MTIDAPYLALLCLVVGCGISIIAHRRSPGFPLTGAMIFSLGFASLVLWSLAGPIALAFCLLTLLLVSLLVPLSAIDLAQHVIHDRNSVPLLILGLLIFAMRPSHPFMVESAVLALCLIAVFLFKQRFIGQGDVLILLAALGWLGLEDWLYAFAIASVILPLFALPSIIRRTLSKGIAFGPAFCIGWLHQWTANVSHPLF